MPIVCKPTPAVRSHCAALALTLPLLSALACIGRPPSVATRLDDRDRVPGATGFVSADTGSARGDFNNPPPTDGGEGEGEDGGDRTVEEGDIYRVLESGLIANLNAYRGLQLIDVSDPDAPVIVGRAQISGYPVELYERDGIVYALMNDWSGYWGSRFASSFEMRTGGVVAAIDIREPAAPLILEQAYVPGSITKSRLTRGASGAALYVVASDYAQVDADDGSSTWAARTIVRSFDVTEDTLAAAGAVDLGGWVTDIAATTEALLVARVDTSSDAYVSTVALVDISDPHGALVLGDEVGVAGYVASQFNMDLRGDVLRVVSGSTWSGTQTNHVETFDASDLSNVVPLDSATFGEGEQLFATLFLDDAGFFVTYLRVDPFHAFEIGADGTLTERSEFVVSGWNDFFRATLDDTRLIGIGTNDEQGRTMSVSLYDVTDLSNPTPLLARADIEVDTSWSEASWDHRAFSVVEDAVSVASGEVTETGLVLLPFQGWDSGAQTYTTAVQIFTYSASTLTRRGVMDHGTPVRRSFLADDALAANLSDEALSLYDTATPDTPVARGRIELAPNYVDVLPLAGGYSARVNGNADYYWYWWGAQAELPPNAIDVLAPGAHPDTGAPIATIELSASAVVYASGDTLVAVDTHVIDTAEWPYETESDVRVYDMSDPGVPVLASSFTTDRIQGNPYGAWYGWGEDCIDCGGWWYAPSSDVHAVPGGLAFLSRHPMQESLGEWEHCNTYPEYEDSCDEEPDGGMTCSYTGGGIYCARPLDEDEATCTGNIERCTYSYDESGNYEYRDCETLDVDDVATTRNCYTSEQFRAWMRFTVDVLDVRDPTNASLAPLVELPEHDEAISARVQGSTLWLSFVRPTDVPGDTAAYVRWYARPVDLHDVAAPEVGTAINVPGQLLAVEGSEATLRDWLWNDGSIETAIHQVDLDREAGLATLTATRRFTDRYVSEVKLDGAGHVLVNHRSTSWSSDEVNHLAVLDASLDVAADVEVDTWATLKDGVAGRALFQVPGGLLIMNLDDPTAPYPQAYFALRGWPTRVLVQARDVVLPAGRYGIYRFDIDAENLLGEIAPQ